MSDILTATFLTAFLGVCIANAIPVMLAGAGEAIGERSGVLNLGIAGLMLLGGYAAFATTLATGSAWLGFLAGAGAGLAGSVLFTVLTVWLGLNQIVVGIALTLAGEGITSVLHTQVYGASNPRLGAPFALAIPGLDRIPVLGKVLFSQPPMFYLSFVILIAAAFLLRKTDAGLRLRAAGQMPAALDASGASVPVTRSLATLAAGALAGVGGAYLVLVTTGTFTPFMVGGLGMIAVVVAMLSHGRMIWVAAASLVYGISIAVGTGLQLTGVTVPTDLIKMLPFVVVMAVLIIFARSSLLPPALGESYLRGVR